MRILLVQPDWRSGDIGFRLAAMPEPLGLEMLAAVVPDHEVRILDMRVDGDLKGTLEEFAPDVVAVTALTPEVYAAQDVLSQAKEYSSEIFTLVGGHHVSLLPEDFYLPYVDAIAIGEGELVFPRVVEELSGERKFGRIANLIWRGEGEQFTVNPVATEELNMDLLPLPRWDLTASYRPEYFFLFDRPDTSVATGRGCPYRCSFCSVWVFYQGKTKQMSAERVIREIAAVETDHITFVDDNFLMNYRRENNIADLIKTEGIHKRFSMECRTDTIVRHPELIEKWVDIGLYAVLLGLEGSDETLRSVNKKNSVKANDEAIRILHDNGVIIWGAFIADPDWEEDSFKALRDYVDSREITHTQFTVLTPLPGSDFWRERYDDLLTHNYSCYDCLHPVIPTRLPREEFYKQFASLYRQRGLGPYYELVRAGKLTIEDCKRGKQMLDTMANWESYIPNDPVLGNIVERPAHHRPSPAGIPRLR